MYAIQSNLFPLFILIVILISLYYQKDFSHSIHKYFYRMLYVIGLLLLVDLMSEFSNSKEGFAMYVIHSASTFSLYALSGFIGFLWFSYVYGFIHEDKIMPIKHRILSLLPALILILLSFLSIFLDVLYTIDATNTYQRGSLFLSHAVILYGYITAVFMIIIYNRKKLSKKDIIPLLSIPIFPALGGLIQIMSYGVLLLWPSTVISVLIVYIFIQSKIIAIDSLTDLLNRRAFSHKVKEIDKSKSSKSNLGAILIDINHFKQINDQYGHHQGDQVLIFISHLFKKIFHPQKTLYRIGGDEFFIIIPSTNLKSLHVKINALKDSLLNQKVFPFPIDISIGALIYDKDLDMNFEKFMVRLDQLMYQQKVHHIIKKDV